MKRTWLAVGGGLAVVLFAGASLLAQSILDKKTPVTILLPSSFLVSEGSTFIGTLPIYGIELSRMPDGQSMPTGSPDWKATGFPVLLHVYFEKMGIVDGRTVVEYRTPDYRDVKAVVKFRMATTVNEADMLRPFVVPTAGSDVDVQELGFIAETYQLIAARHFPSAAAGAIIPKLVSLVGQAERIGFKRGQLGFETFKEKAYLVADTGGDGKVYNELKLNEGQRLAEVANSTLLSTLKRFAVLVRENPVVQGVKLRASIAHYDFLNKNASPKHDYVSIYAPADGIRKFTDADITSQDFIDGCIVMVNENRVKLILTAGGSPR